MFEVQLAIDGELESLMNPSKMKEILQSVKMAFQEDSFFGVFGQSSLFGQDGRSLKIIFENLNFPSDRTQFQSAMNFLWRISQNKLRTMRVDDFVVSVSASASISNNPNDIIMYGQFKPNVLKQVERNSEMESRLESLNFPAEHIPDHYKCALTNQVMDFPAYDIKQPETICERRALIMLTRDKQENPFTRESLTSDQIKIDFKLRDQVLSLIEKIEMVHKKDCLYDNFMQDILNPELSSLAFAQKNFRGKNLADNVVQQGLDLHNSKRFLDAIFCLGQNKSSIPLVLLVRGSLYYECDKPQKALEELQQTQVEAFSGASNYFVYVLLLSRVYIKLDKYDEVAKLLLLHKRKFEDNPSIDLRTSFLRLQFLAEFKVQDNYVGYSRGLRRLVASCDDLQKLIQFMMLFPRTIINTKDTNAASRDTALHLAIRSRKFSMAMYLIFMGAKVDIENTKEKKTAMQMIREICDDQWQQLLHPYFIFVIKLDPKAIIPTDQVLRSLAREVSTDPSMVLHQFPYNSQLVGLSAVPASLGIVIFNIFPPGEHILNAFFKFLMFKLSQIQSTVGMLPVEMSFRGKAPGLPPHTLAIRFTTNTFFSQLVGTGRIQPRFFNVSSVQDPAVHVIDQIREQLSSFLAQCIKLEGNVVTKFGRNALGNVTSFEFIFENVKVQKFYSLILRDMVHDFVLLNAENAVFRAITVEGLEIMPSDSAVQQALPQAAEPAFPGLA